jgi:hypothetical protein
MARLRDFFHLALPLRTLFEFPTIAELAEAVVNAQAEQEGDEELQRLLSEIQALSDDEAGLAARQINEEVGS